MSVAGKVVIITGASSGIGEAMARDLAKHGAKVMLAARREDRLERIRQELVEAGGAAAHRVTDVTSRADVEALAGAALERFGRIDVMINNAGVMSLALLRNLRVEEWDRMIDVNIKGVLYGIAAVVPHMRTQGSGHIINIASVAAHRICPAAAVYCGAKAAVRAISEGLRLEERGVIRVTVISPGAVTTELPAGTTDEQARASLDRIFDGALAREEIAAVVRYAIDQPANVAFDEIIMRANRKLS